MKLYVGNISFNLSSQDIRTAFAEFGRVESADVICDRITGRSRGFAFVHMVSDDEGESAIAGMHGQVLDGRPLVVSESKPAVQAQVRPNYVRPDQRNDPSSTYYGGRSW
jgi:RNA recognition motif-containing protein